MKQFLSQTVLALASVLVAMVAFWMVEGRNLVTREHVKSMISSETPYVVDRKLIFEAIADRRRSHESLARAIHANTSAVADLRVAIAQLSTEAKHLHHRIVQSDDPR